MASSLARASVALVLLAVCFAMCKSVAAGPRHTCAYPQACTYPGAPDPTHIVTATAQYNPTTKKCENIPSVTGPHDCQKFATKADCKENCGDA